MPARVAPARVGHDSAVHLQPLRWNPHLSKAFDVSREQFPARSAEEALVAKYLEVEIKHLERREARIPSVRLGAYLTAIGDVLRTWSVDDVRNLNDRGEETPPSYEVIQLNSTQRADFLVDGMRFLRQIDGTTRATVRVEPGWYGLDLTVYGMRETGAAEQLLGAITQRSREINFLKGEAFALSGAFLPRTDETFADLFLDPKNTRAMERLTTLVNTRGAALENRGVLLMGPPGTGKTLAARILRNQADATFIWVSSRDFHYAGSFGGFSHAFALARECAPTVLVFEDIDNWLDGYTIDLIKTEMDGVAKSAGVVTMMTTNHPESLPAALIDRPGRFHDVLKFDLPGDAPRRQMLTSWLPGLAAADLTRATAATAGYSGAHVRELARFTAIIAEQDDLPLAEALTVALAKLAEQRDLITATQRTGSRYRMPPDLTTKHAATPEVVRRAHSLLTIKAINQERRVISGIASTPEVDRVGDIVEPLGVTFRNPTPLLLYHDTQRPVGLVTFGQPTKDGITFDATIPVIEEPGTLRDRVDEAWQSVKAGLIAGVSIGFRALERGVEPMKSGGLRFLKTEVVELSLVTVAANASAAILAIKALEGRPAAFGTSSPLQLVKRSGVSDITPRVAPTRRDATMKTIADQITTLENTRAASSARMTAIMQKSADENRSTDDAEREEFDTLETEVERIDGDLRRLKSLEQTNKAAAKPVAGDTPAHAATTRGGGVITMKANVPPGTAFTRYAMALVAGRGSRLEAVEYAKRWESSTPEVVTALKAPMAPGTTLDADWAAPLVVYQNIASEFVALLRPATIIGRIPGLRRVPFNVTMPTQTQGATVGWVGQNAPKPVSELKFGSISLGMAKAAGIVVLSEELVRSSQPAAEGIVRADLIATIGQFLDRQFVDPGVAEVTNVSPASITRDVTPITASGTDSDALRADVKALIASFTAANMSVAGSVWIMTETQAQALAMMQNPLGQPEFTGLTITGGTFFGLPVVTSENIPLVGASPDTGSRIILVKANEILLADDDGVTLDVSREASVQMESEPTNPPVAATVMVSLWQNNLVGLRAERFINWKRRRLAAVGYINAANYGDAA